MFLIAWRSVGERGHHRAWGFWAGQAGLSAIFWLVFFFWRAALGLCVAERLKKNNGAVEWGY